MIRELKISKQAAGPLFDADAELLAAVDPEAVSLTRHSLPVLMDIGRAEGQAHG